MKQHIQRIVVATVLGTACALSNIGCTEAVDKVVEVAIDVAPEIAMIYIDDKFNPSKNLSNTQKERFMVENQSSEPLMIEWYVNNAKEAKWSGTLLNNRVQPIIMHRASGNRARIRGTISGNTRTFTIHSDSKHDLGALVVTDESLISGP